MTSLACLCACVAQERAVFLRLRIFRRAVHQDSFHTPLCCPVPAGSANRSVAGNPGPVLFFRTSNRERARCHTRT